MATMPSTTEELLILLDYVRDRTLSRLQGMADAEYLWEPVPDTLSVRPDDTGTFRADAAPEPESVPAPVSTIAWRIWHIGNDCLRGYSQRFFLSLPAPDDEHLFPGTAAEGIKEMEAHWAHFRADVAALDDDKLHSAMGPHARSYADYSYLSLVLHALDEVIHHCAEIGLLRDLYLRLG